MPKVAHLHSWDVTTTQARDLQIELASRVNTTKPIGPFRTIAGSDVSYNRKGKWLFGTVIVLDAKTLEVVEKSGVVVEAKFPYVPGLLSFREAPAVLQAYEALRIPPDVLVCDGQGLAHPRHLGLACHIGLWVGIPTIGCAKSRLYGHFDEPGPDPGDWTPLLDDHDESTIGAALRTRKNVNPLFISPGHLSNLEDSIAAIFSTVRKYRIPAPTRAAHEYVNELRIQGPPRKKH